MNQEAPLLPGKRGAGLGPLEPVGNDRLACHGRREQRPVRAGRSTSLRHEARCARGHEPRAPRRLGGAPQAARTRLCGLSAVVFPAAHSQDGGGRGGRCPARAISVATSSAGPGSARAQHALRQLTRRGCLNAANDVSAVSSATRPRTEQRSAVDAQRRPPPHEPGPGCACRDTLQPRQRSHSRTTASGRKRTLLASERLMPHAMETTR